MKKIFYLLLMTIFLASCNNTSNIKKGDICGKRYTSSVPSPIASGVSSDTGTTLNCNGTFESGEVTRSRGYNSVDRAHFTGTWQIIKEIPEDVKQAVIKFGLKHNDYSVIKYLSSNGVTGYCLYYQVSSENTIEPLNMGQVSSYAYENQSGALGIFGGFQEN